MTKSIFSIFRLHKAVYMVLLAVVVGLIWFIVPAATQEQKAADKLSQNLREHFKNYSLLHLSTEEINARARAVNHITFSTDERRFEISLRLNDLRASGYRAEETNDAGETVPVEMGEIRTFKGKVDNLEGSSDVRLTIDRNTFEGVIVTAPRTTFIESAKKFSAVAADTDFVVYDASDVIGNESYSCGVTLSDRVEKETLAISKDSLPKSVPFAPTANLKILEIATEADNEYVTFFGSSASANAEITSIVNQVDAIYQSNLGITLQIVNQHTWTGMADPYTSTDPQTMLNEFTNYWNNPNNTAVYNIQRDLAHMWTGRDMNGDIAGWSATGVICGTPNQAYGISQRFADAVIKVGITAHEFGHSFNATHPNQANPPVSVCDLTIMHSSTGTNTQMYFCPFSRDQINSYVSTHSSCLSEGPPANPIDFNLAVSQNTPSTREVGRGFSTTFSISLTRQGAFTGSIDFSATNLPNGTEALFNPYTVYVPGTGAIPGIGVKINVAANTLPGTYPITITGNSGALQHSTTVTLVVNNFSGQVLPTNTNIYGINNNGVIAANIPSQGNVLYNLDTGISTPMPAIGTFKGINDSGDLIGYTATANSYQANLYKNGQITPIQPPNEPIGCTPESFNNSAQIILRCFQTLSGSTGKYYFYSNGTSTFLASYNTSSNDGFSPFKINALGQVLINTVTNNVRKAAVAVNGVITIIQPPAGFQQTNAYTINDRGQVLLDATSTTGTAYYIYDIAAQTLTPLPNVPSGVSVTNRNLSNDGRVLFAGYPTSAVFSNGAWQTYSFPSPPITTIYGFGLGITRANVFAVKTIPNPGCTICRNSAEEKQSTGNLQPESPSLPHYIYLNNQWQDFDPLMNRVIGVTNFSSTNLTIYALTEDNRIFLWDTSSTGNKLYIKLSVTSSLNKFDFDGDGKADVSVFRPSSGAWYLQQSQSGFTGVSFGQTGDVITPADYDGDGKTDVAVFRSGTWYLQRSQLGFTGISFGAASDVPVPADYDGDGKADVAVFRPSTGAWYILGSQVGFYGVSFGQNGDKPVAADYDGDGKADIAVNRGGVWYINRSQLGFTGVQFGDGNDKCVPADYDGDGKADVAVFRPSTGAWYLQRSTAGFTGIGFGVSTDLPVPADYDGDGKTDIAVFRNGTWYLQRSQLGFTGIAFGASTDTPISNAYVR